MGVNTMIALRCGSIRLVVHPLTMATMIVLALIGRFWEGLLILILVAAHEGAHALAAVLLGLRPREIRLIPVGGMLRVEGLTGAGPAVEALVAAAGPAFSLLTALITLAAYRSGCHTKIVIDIFKYSAMLCLFNLLPALPMDGGRILRALLSYLIGFASATKLLKLTGLALIGGMTGAVSFLFFYGHPNLTLIFVTAYLLSAWHREKEFAIYDLYREIAHKSNALKNGKVLPVKEYIILPDTRVLDLLGLCRPGAWCCFRVEVNAAGAAREICFGEDAAMNTIIDCGSLATAADVLRQFGNRRRRSATVRRQQPAFCQAQD